jgi:hypothetical protein
MLQIDAPINHGNSGGPLFVKREERYHWIGINTSGFDQANSLGFAIDVGAFFETKFAWFDANANGAAQALNQFFKSQ